MIKNRKFCWLIVLIISVMLSSIVVACKPDEPPHEHNFGEWHTNSLDGLYCESRLYYRQCECGEIEYRNGTEDDHDYTVVTTEPTCQEGGYDTKTCNICGKITIENETSVIDHKWEYIYDTSKHWKECVSCKEESEDDFHDFDEAGECSTCKMPKFMTNFSFSSNGSEASITKYRGVEKNLVLDFDVYLGVKVTAISSNAFTGKDVESIVIGGDITTIKDDAFYGCTSLRSIDLGENVTSIGDRAFNGCSSLESITMSNGITNIGYMAFYSCSSLVRVIIPDSVINIGDSVFRFCESLSYIKIGQGVKTLGEDFFGYNDNLKTVIMPKGIEKINSLLFIPTSSSINVYYEGSQDDWGEVIIEGSVDYIALGVIYYYSESEPQEDGNYWHYDENGEVAIWEVAV